MATTAVVSEVFLSVQGEGRHIGVPMVFVRLAHCNIECHWCDTPQRKNGVRREMDELWKEVRALLDASGANDVCLTGGEPMLQLAKFSDLVGNVYVDWHLETNGTIIPSLENQGVLALFKCVTVSPKLSSARVPYPTTALEAAPVFDDDAFEWWVSRAVANPGLVQLKFVVADADDWGELDALLPRLRGTEVVLQPQTFEPQAYERFGAELWRRVQAGWGKEHEVRFRWMPRLHEILWGHTPGR